MGPKSGWSGDRLCQTRLIPRSPDGDNKVKKNYKDHCTKNHRERESANKKWMYNPLYRITNSEPLGSLSPLKGNTSNYETTTTIAIKTKSFKCSKFKVLEEIK